MIDLYITLLLIIVRANILVVGDSITAADDNYVNQLRNRTQHYYTKSGHPGRSSTYIKNKVLKMRLSDYTTLILECGINNVDQPNVVISDILEITKFAKRENANMKILVLTLPPYKGYATWTPEKQKSLEKINAWIMSNKNFIGINIYTSLSNKGYSKHSIDKLHPNKKGHEIMALEILKFL